MYFVIINKENLKMFSNTNFSIASSATILQIINFLSPNLSNSRKNLFCEVTKACGCLGAVQRSDVTNRVELLKNAEISV